MPDREKIIKGLETCRTRAHCKECPYAYDKRANDSYCEAVLHNDVLELLKEQEAKPPIHVHEEYTEHDWETDEKGEVNDCAWGQEYCNGPMCKRCYYSFCINCEPNGWDKKPCIVDFFKCPDCGERISESTKFCSNCGQAVKWE